MGLHPTSFCSLQAVTLVKFTILTDLAGLSWPHQTCMVLMLQRQTIYIQQLSKCLVVTPAVKQNTPSSSAENDGQVHRA